MGELRRPGALRPDPPRRAREPRHQDRRRARARGARRRDASAAQRSCRASACVRSGSDSRHRLRRRRRSRRRRPAADVRTGSVALDVSWEIDLSGRLRAGASAAAADALAAEHGARGVRLLVLTDVATQLLHARRRAAPARDRARHLGGAGRDAAAGHGAPARRPRHAVRRRARADRRRAQRARRSRRSRRWPPCRAIASRC